MASQGQQAGVSAYDTGSAGLTAGGSAAAEALSGDALAKKEGWVKIAEGKKAAIKGGAALVNPRMAVVLRPKANGADIYGTGADGSKLRAHVVPIGDADGMTLTSVSAVSAADAASLEAVYKSGKGTALTVTYSLGPMNPILRTKPGAGVVGQRIEAQTRLGVLPDFFADDMVIDARAIPIDKAEIPAENFFMNMLDNGNAMVTAIWDKNKRDIELSLAGDKDARVITGVNIFYGDGGMIWLAALEQKGIWAQAEITESNVKQITTLEWKCPFRAKWKGDFMRTDHTVDSWEFEYLSGGIMPGKSPRWRWSGVVGGHDWPCWFDEKDTAKAGIQPATKFPNGSFAGPFVVYPIDRNKDTPLDQLTVTDLMRDSLGIGPCELITDAAGQGSSDKGLFTCAVDAMAPAIFAGDRQKEERVFLKKMLKETQVFVKAIGDRINSYVEFRGQTLQYLGEQKKAHPELADFIVKLEAQTGKIQASKVDRNGAVAGLAEQIMKEAVSDSPRPDINKLTVEGGGGIATHGGWQDDVVARARNAVKILRQMATIEMAMNPKSAELCKEMRKRTQQILRGSLGHEMR
jgi:hypothetical protein